MNNHRADNRRAETIGLRFKNDLRLEEMAGSVYESGKMISRDREGNVTGSNVSRGIIRGDKRASWGNEKLCGHVTDEIFNFLGNLRSRGWFVARFTSDEAN